MGAVTNPTVRYVFIDMSRMFVYQQYAKHCIIYSLYFAPFSIPLHVDILLI